MQQQDTLVQPTKSNKTKAITKILIFVVIVGIFAGIYAFFWNTTFKWHQETEDAYVNSHQNIVTAQLAGNIVKITIDDTQFIKKGELIAQIDPTDYLIAVDSARIDLENSIRKYYALTHTSNVSKDTLSAKKIDFNKIENDYKRDTLSLKSGLISKEQYDVIKNNYNQSKIQYTIAKSNYENDLIQSFAGSVQQHPEVEKSMLNYKKALIDLERTNIYATVDGVVAKRSMYLGQRINVNQNLLTIVDTNHAWIDANFKETQLKDLKLGQSVEIISDLNKQIYEGVIVGVSVGSGSAFSLLPAQNATGNWIKVVQRVPVKIAIDANSLKTHGALPIGSSVVVDVNTHTDQVLKNSKIDDNESTEIFSVNHQKINETINDIIKANVLKFDQ